MAIRDEQVALTRERIVETFLDLASRAGARPVTMAQVARSSGISPATVYRHFSNRQELVAAAAHRDATLGVEHADGSWTLDDVRTHLVVLWGRLATNIAVTRESVMSDAGLELRRARLEPLLELLRRTLTEAGVDVDAADGRHLLRSMTVLMGVHAFIDLHDRHGLTAEDAADTVTWAIAELLRARGLDPEHLTLIESLGAGSPGTGSPVQPGTDRNGDRP